MSWSEVGMFFLGFLFGCWYWRREIRNSARYIQMGQQMVRNQEAEADLLSKTVEGK